jgi:hypothetical protein
MKGPIKNPKNIGTKKDLLKEFEDSLRELAAKVDCTLYPLIIPPLDSIDEDILFNIYPDL